MADYTENTAPEICLQWWYVLSEAIWRVDWYVAYIRCPEMQTI